MPHESTQAITFPVTAPPRSSTPPLSRPIPDPNFSVSSPPAPCTPPLSRPIPDPKFVNASTPEPEEDAPQTLVFFLVSEQVFPVFFSFKTQQPPEANVLFSLKTLRFVPGVVV